MQVFVFVLNRTEHLEHLLQEFSDQGLRGATVLDSRGMARILHTEDEMPIFYGLRAIMEPEHRSSKPSSWCCRTNRWTRRGRSSIR